MKMPEWLNPDKLRCRIVRPGCACPGAPLRHSDVLATPGWMVPTRAKTVDYPPRQRFPPQEVIDLSATARFGRSISTTSVAIELDQPVVADPEVMRNLVEHDVPDHAA